MEAKIPTNKAFDIGMKDNHLMLYLPGVLFQLDEFPWCLCILNILSLYLIIWYYFLIVIR